MKIPDHRISIHAMYYKIAMDHSKKYKTLDKDLKNLETYNVAEDEIEKIGSKILSCYEDREKAAVISITFSGMSLEAFFYDYAAMTLGDEYVKEHLDKLNLTSKFVLYPKLICGKAPDKANKAYNSVHNLKKLRNELVHFKSKAFKLNELNKASDYHSELNDKLKSGVINAVKCVTLVMQELDELHADGSNFNLRMQCSIEP